MLAWGTQQATETHITPTWGSSGGDGVGDTTQTHPTEHRKADFPRTQAQRRPPSLPAQAPPAVPGAGPPEALRGREGPGVLLGTGL